jgi:transposase
MERRKFGREFKIEAVRLVKERGVSVAQAARDLDVHENVLRKWVRDFAADPGQAFPGHGQMKPEQLEIDRLRREVAKLKAERDILKNHLGGRPPVGAETARDYPTLGRERPAAFWWS